MEALEKSLNASRNQSPNKNDDVDDDFDALIVNRANSITQEERKQSVDHNPMVMSELKASNDKTRNDQPRGVNNMNVAPQSTTNQQPK